jgi:flagellar hook-length control protein FliK
MVRPGDAQQVTLKLNPESLGQVDLHFSAKGDHLTVTMTATSAAAEAALREGVDDLTESIMRRGERFQTVEIRVEQREGQGPSRENRAGEERREGQARQGDPRSGDSGQGRHPRREPGSTAEAWYDLARGGR